MPDRIDAAMHAVQASRDESALDRPVRVAQGQQLVMGYDAVLPRRKLGLFSVLSYFRSHAENKCDRNQNSPPWIRCSRISSRITGRNTTAGAGEHLFACL